MATADTESNRSMVEKCDVLFSAWVNEIEKICYTAVYHQQQDVMVLMYRNLIRRQEFIKQMIEPLDRHLGKSSKLSSAPMGLKDPQPATNGRVAASLPGMNGSINATAPPAAPANGNSDAGSYQGYPIFTPKYVPPPWRDKSSSANAAPLDWRAVSSNKLCGHSESTLTGRSTPDDASSTTSEESGIAQPRKVFLTNLARESESKTIAAYFRKYGSVVDVKIFRFPSGESRGFGSVEFIDIASADRAIRAGKHVIDHREVEAKLFVNRESSQTIRGTRRYQIFLGGVPSFLSRLEVEESIQKVVKIRDLKLNSQRGYAYLDLEDDDDARRLIGVGHIKIGEKMVECKENKRR